MTRSHRSVSSGCHAEIQEATDAAAADDAVQTVINLSIDRLHVVLQADCGNAGEQALGQGVEQAFRRADRQIAKCSGAHPLPLLHLQIAWAVRPWVDSGRPMAIKDGLLLAAVPPKAGDPLLARH